MIKIMILCFKKSYIMEKTKVEKSIILFTIDKISKSRCLFILFGKVDRCKPL